MLPGIPHKIVYCRTTSTNLYQIACCPLAAHRNLGLLDAQQYMYIGLYGVRMPGKPAPNYALPSIPQEPAGRLPSTSGQP